MSMSDLYNKRAEIDREIERLRRKEEEEREVVIEEYVGRGVYERVPIKLGDIPAHLRKSKTHTLLIIDPQNVPEDILTDNVSSDDLGPVLLTQDENGEYQLCPKTNGTCHVKIDSKIAVRLNISREGETTLIFRILLPERSYEEKPKWMHLEQTFITETKNESVTYKLPNPYQTGSFLLDIYYEGHTFRPENSLFFIVEY